MLLKHSYDPELRLSHPPGVIAEFDVIHACHQANYRYYGNWRELSPPQQAKLVAHYLLDLTIKAHKQDAEQSEMERKKPK